MDLDITKAIPILFEHVTTYYQTPETWIGHNATHYHNFNHLLHALPYIFSQLHMNRSYSNALLSNL